MNMKFELLDTRIDATGFKSEESATEELKDVSRIPLQGGSVAVVVSPWKVNVSTANPQGHGWGVPGRHVYAVARFVVMPEADQHDTGKILVEYRRKLREAIKSNARFNCDSKWAQDEIKRIEPRIFQLGLGFTN